jgi:hypothetical protein
MMEQLNGLNHEDTSLKLCNNFCATLSGNLTKGSDNFTDFTRTRQIHHSSIFLEVLVFCNCFESVPVGKVDFEQSYLLPKSKGEQVESGQFNTTIWYKDVIVPLKF